MSFLTKLHNRWNATDSMLCVGLDPDVSRFPAGMNGRVDAIADFCISIVDATARYACAFKPQIAYFAAVGAESQLQRVCDHIRSEHPDVPLILDAKRGDIGDTAKLYAREAFERHHRRPSHDGRAVSGTAATCDPTGLRAPASAGARHS